MERVFRYRVALASPRGPSERLVMPLRIERLGCMHALVAFMVPWSLVYGLWRYLRVAVAFSSAMPLSNGSTSTDFLSLTARRTTVSIGMWSSPRTYQ